MALTKAQRKTWFLSALGIFMDGFDLFIMAVALPLIADVFDASPLEVGLIGSAAVFGAIFGAVFLGRLADRIGRKRLFAIDMGIFFVGALLSALAPGVWFLVLMRFVLGIGIGADYPISAAYIAESMPAKARGRRMIGAFSFQAIGMISGALIGIALIGAVEADWVWRIMLGAGMVPAAIIIVLRRGMGESERWERSRADGVPTPKARTLLAPTLRRRTVLATVPWFLMDICLYGVGIFTPTILAILHLTGRGDLLSQDLASSRGAAFLDVFLLLGFGAALLLVERLGRIRLQVLGFAGAALGMALLTGSVLTDTADSAKAVVFLGFAMFNFCVNLGPNATTFLLPAELFPTNIRATGHGISAACGKAGAAFGILLLPLLISGIGLGLTLTVVTCAAIAGLIVTVVFGIDTRGNLDDADDAGKPGLKEPGQ